MASEVRVNTITNRSGLSTVTFGAYGIEFVGITTVEQLNVSSAVTNINATGVSTFAGNIDLNADLDVDGHTELDGVNIAGVLTATSANFSGNVTVLGDLTYENVTNQDSIGIATARSGLRITGGGLDVVGVSTFNDNINLGDNDILNIGNSEDLKIYHSSNTSFIRDTGAGNLNIDSVAGSVNIRVNSNESAVVANQDGSVELFWDNSRKFETTSSGINVVGTTTTGQLSVTGVSTFSGNVNLGDSNILNLGAGNDLKIYHNGTNNYIDNNADFFLRVNNGTETSLYATANGGVQLNYDNVKKFETTSTGIDVTGEVQGDSLDIDGNADISGVVTLHSNLNLQDNDVIYIGTGSDLQIYHDGSNSYISHDNVGSLIIDQNRTDGATFIRSDNGSGGITNYVQANGADGSVYLYHYGSEKLKTLSTGINVTGTLQANRIDAVNTGGPMLILKDSDSSDNAATMWLEGHDSAGTQKWYVGDINTNGDLRIRNQQSGSLVLGSNSNDRVIIDPSGNLTPDATNTYDLGTSSKQWRNAYFDGTVYVDTLEAEGPSRITNGDLQIHNSTGPQLRLRDDNSTGDATVTWLRGENMNGTQMWYLGDTNADGAINLMNQQNNNIYFGTNANNRCVLDANGHFSPVTNNTYDLGTSSLRWRNLYTNDLNLSNEGSTNDVDGTWGNYTIQEGENDLFLINRRSGKKYKFNLTEVE